MFFGQLSDQRHLPVSQRLLQLSQRSRQSMGRFVDYNGPGLLFQLLQDAAPLLLSDGRNASKQNLLVGSPEIVRAVTQAAGPGRKSPVSVPHSTWPPVLPRIRNTGSPCIGDQRHRHAFLHFPDQILSFFYLIIFMITGERCFNIKMIQQLPAVSRILRRDQINLFQRP